MLQSINSNLPEKILDLKNSISSAEERIHNLEEELKFLLANREYSKANQVKNELSDLKEFFKNNKKNLLTLEHKNAASLHDQAKEKEYSEFENFWDSKMADFEHDVEIVEQEIKDRQNQDLEYLVEKFESQKNKKILITSEMASLRAKENGLIVNQMYLEAQEVKDKLDQLEYEQEIKLEQRNKEKFETAILDLKTKQEKEIKIWRMKAESRRGDLYRTKQTEFQKLKNKYKNLKLEMKNIQAKENRRLEIMSKNVSVKHFESLENRKSTIRTGIVKKSNMSQRSRKSVKSNTERSLNLKTKNQREVRKEEPQDKIQNMLREAQFKKRKKMIENQSQNSQKEGKENQKGFYKKENEIIKEMPYEVSSGEFKMQEIDSMNGDALKKNFDEDFNHNQNEN